MPDLVARARSPIIIHLVHWRSQNGQLGDISPPDGQGQVPSLDCLLVATDKDGTIGGHDRAGARSEYLLAAERYSLPQLPSLLINRVAELEALERWVRSDQAAVSPMLLLGPRGCGKTMIARVFAQRFTEALGEPLLINGQQFIRNAGAIHSFVQWLMRRHSERSGYEPRLIVFDDVDQALVSPARVDEFEAVISRHAPDIRWLLTSGFDVGQMEPGKTIPWYAVAVGPLTDEASRALLLRQLERSLESDTGATSRLRLRPEDVSLLVEAAGGNPRILMALAERALRVGVGDALAGEVFDVLAEDLDHLLLVAGTGGLSVVPAHSLGPHGIVAPNEAFLPAIPHLYLPRFARYWAKPLAELEILINDPHVTEESLQSFFQSHPRFLTQFSYADAVPQAIFEREGAGPLRPDFDFFLQPLTGSLGDIVDLKLPTESLIVGRRDRLRFSAKVADAISQVIHYRDYFEDAPRREAVRRRYGFTAYRPRVAIIVGNRQPNIDEIEYRRIHDQSPSYVTITTYDDVLQRARRFAQAIAE